MEFGPRALGSRSILAPPRSPTMHDRWNEPVLVNTSFNTRGKPLVCAPRDALECFYMTPLDILAIGPFVLKKVAQP